MDKELISMIVKTLRELHEHEETKIPADLGGETPLFGRDGILDSVGLVTLVVAVEQACEDEFGVSISLADEKALSQRNSPYQTIGSLAAYASRLI
ncbi:hypothetical protein LCGC14_2148130 [marine sediment metagenome]|uniref:Carrier domain-containing protein n=1 Tax=marine sediment metagenome TaxID=412755 RepID=A0A0F9DW82_9ZZZZ|nr:acyl carrier protein [Desulfobacterales bacterium]